MINFIKGLFGIDAVVNTATKLVDKFSGTDFTAKEKAEWILKYQESTKHQSPARRAIAISMVGFWLLCGLSWLVFNTIGRLVGFDPAMMLADDIEVFMGANLLTPTNIIIGFYFATHIIKK
ncbi:TMhelix containing protein [Vibrio phage 1.162.O._10N.261.48.E3]|nr:TMhelix containing protein [Vibrio phage 1.147.O._10N.286.49.E9]AUR91695.1 TMhelix containing protein [Vibrio phage 1.162.O._10N.261.48.E3]